MLMFNDFAIFSFGSGFVPWNGPILGKFGGGPYEEHLGKFIWALKTCLQGYANNKGADQPSHPRRLVSAFVIGLLENIISRLATSEISIF